LLIVGGILLPLGFLVILVGWMGASRTPLLFEQVPYLLSGGVLGLGLVFAGGFIYFAYWQTLLVRESRQHSDQNTQLIAGLSRIEGLLRHDAGDVPDPQSENEAGAVSPPNLRNGRGNSRPAPLPTPGIRD
jgi:hypothetical protein